MLIYADVSCLQSLRNITAITLEQFMIDNFILYIIYSVVHYTYIVFAQ